MDTAGTIGLVWGYLPGVDARSDVAVRAGLLQRFSLAFDRYPDSAPQVYMIDFRKDLVVSTLSHLLSLFPHDSLCATDLHGRTHSSLEGACLHDPEDESWEPVSSILALQGGQPVCYVEHEPYEDIGGPHPYHDAFVYAFYCRHIDRRVVQNALAGHAASLGATVLDVVSGETQPVKAPWWRRLLDWWR